MFENDLDLTEIANLDPQRDVKILTRCLAAFAVYSTTGCSNDEAANAVWDGSDDNGIDAAYFDPEERQVVVVQSKWIQSGSGEPEASAISTFADGVRDLVENAIDSFAERLHEKVEVISEALMQPGTTIRLIVVSTGSSVLAQHGTRKLDRLVEELNDGEDDGIATFSVLGMSEVFKGLASDANVGKITLAATLLDWSRVTHPHKAYVGIIDGSQLKSWWHNHGKRIVAKNIRYALGDTEVNSQIKGTAESSPENFWYFHNGITLIADEASRAPSASASHASGNFEFRGASIVNGAQTVSTLARVANDEALGSVKVSMRVILLSEAPDDFGSNVTRTNNLQNRVEGRDFVSRDPEQDRIRGEMSLEQIDYQIHRSEDFVPTAISCDLIEVTTALACASSEPSHSVAAKTGIGRFYNDLSRAPYKAIFNPNTTGARAFNAVRILRAVDKWIIERKSQADRKSGYSWGLLVHGNRALAGAVFERLGNDLLDQPISDFPADYESKVFAACEEVYPAMLDHLEKDFPNKALAVLFKGPTNCKTIHEYVSQQLSVRDFI
ncbi:MAG: AIPR family protein [Nitratireductor sp.]|uniref:AIPR family protein n=1 Tax=Nitratireductor sp. TaxID=1872084 RepID=UPI00262F4547|nr:AIPR family protein [Nitratireductor sp.]MCV0350573.1 AIPR family protein [Nitratireductor sp.]